MIIERLAGQWRYEILPKNFDAALKLGNIPIINLRNEFRMWNKWLRSREVRRGVESDSTCEQTTLQH